MTNLQILDYIRTQYLPLEFSIPEETILQCINNTIRYFNTHSAVRKAKMYPSAKVVTIDPDFKDVIEVMPSAQAMSVALADPSWTLLGIQVMNYMSSDLIAINEGYKGYLSYLGTDFRFHFEPSQDPTVGGKLYLQSIPSAATDVCVVGTKRIIDGEDITNEWILEWVLKASYAQVRTLEGNVLRKADIAGIKNDGQANITEGQEEWKLCKEELAKNSRWFAIGKRI